MQRGLNHSYSKLLVKHVKRHFCLILPDYGNKKSHQLLSSLSTPDWPQRPNSAKLENFVVPMASVYPAPSSATMTTTAQTAQMRLPAPSPPAALDPSSATTPFVCRPCGNAMETRIVPTGRMSGRRTVWNGSRTRRRCTAESTNFSVLMGIVSTAAGGVMEAWTARIDRTRSTAVSLLSLSISYS